MENKLRLSSLEKNLYLFFFFNFPQETDFLRFFLKLFSYTHQICIELVKKTVILWHTV